MIKFAVISFPGTNCETESVRALKRVGMDAEVVLWNDPDLLGGEKRHQFAGYLIAGGFSYEDRGRSGVVAAQEPITQILKEEAAAGKVIVGICNGAQILVETGLVPGFDGNPVAMALTWNEMKSQGHLVGTGFYNSWVYLKNAAPKGRSAFNDFDSLIHIPMAHGEGRFVIPEDVLKILKENNQILFKYATAAGEIDPDFPVTPNGSPESIAAISNPGGNVMAMMPHPERDPRGNGHEIFESVKRWIETGQKPLTKTIGTHKVSEDIRSHETYDAEIWVRLIITDNTERTLEAALQKTGQKAGLKRFAHYGLRLKKGVDVLKTVEKCLAEGELANPNKELIWARVGDQVYQYDKAAGLTPATLPVHSYLIVRDKTDLVGEAKLEALGRHVGDFIERVDFGVLWNVTPDAPDQLESAIRSHILYNPYSMFVTVA